MTWMLALAWFILYWILGGILFAVVALTRLLRIKKAQFSCLFTFASAAAAYGAATTGLMMAPPSVIRCWQGALVANDWGQFVGCGVREVFFSGGAWFALLVLLSIMFMLLSQRDLFPAKLEHH